MRIDHLVGHGCDGAVPGDREVVVVAAAAAVRHPACAAAVPAVSSRAPLSPEDGVWILDTLFGADSAFLDASEPWLCCSAVRRSRCTSEGRMSSAMLMNSSVDGGSAMVCRLQMLTKGCSGSVGPSGPKDGLSDLTTAMGCCF